MASVSVSHLIIFIASLLVAASVAGTLITGVDEISTSVDEQSDDLTERIDTDITIISDPNADAIYSENGSESTVTLLVKNTGRTTLDDRPGGIDVLVDGRYESADSVELVSGDDSWSPGAVARITADLNRTLGTDVRAAVVVNNNRDAIEFRT